MILYKKIYILITLSSGIAMPFYTLACTMCEGIKPITTVQTTISSHIPSTMQLRDSVKQLPLATEAEPFLSTLIAEVKKNASLIVGTTVITSILSYCAYALYVNYTVNGVDRLCYWVSHELRNGSFDQFELLEYINNRYSELEKIHPLTVIFAALHDVEIEIEECLQLRSIIQNLTFFKIQALISENAVTINKKIEYLYILKMSLMNMSTETRTRCRKNIALNTLRQ